MTADSAKTTPDRYRRRVKRIGLGLMFAFYMVVPIPIRLVGGSIGFDVVFLWTFGWIGLLLCGGACLLWWRIVDAHAKRITPSNVLWTVLVLLPVILIGGRAVYRSWPSVRVERVLYNVADSPRR